MEEIKSEENNLQATNLGNNMNNKNDSLPLP
jgi:hypothetical protein